MPAAPRDGDPPLLYPLPRWRGGEDEQSGLGAAAVTTHHDCSSSPRRRRGEEERRGAAGGDAGGSSGRRSPSPLSSPPLARGRGRTIGVGGRCRDDSPRLFVLAPTEAGRGGEERGCGRRCRRLLGTAIPLSSILSPAGAGARTNNRGWGPLP